MIRDGFSDADGGSIRRAEVVIIPIARSRYPGISRLGRRSGAANRRQSDSRGTEALLRFVERLWYACLIMTTQSRTLRRAGKAGGPAAGQSGHGGRPPMKGWGDGKDTRTFR